MTPDEKAARLGWRPFTHGEPGYEDAETGASRLWCESGSWRTFEDWRRWPTLDIAIDALYAERFGLRDAAYLAGVKAGLEAAEKVCVDVARDRAGFGAAAATECKARVAALNPATIAAEAAKERA